MVWVAIAVSLGLAIISAGVQYAMMDRTPPPGAKPPQFDPAKALPVVTESEPIPVVFGTFPVSASNVLALGDFTQQRALESVGSVLAERFLEVESKQFWWFRANLIFGICQGHADLIRRVDIDGDRVLNWGVGTSAADLTPDGITGRGEAEVDIYHEFSTEGSEGFDVLAGRVFFDDGGPVSQLNGASLVPWDITTNGKLRGLTTALVAGKESDATEEFPDIFDGGPFIHGTRPVIRPWRFLVQRIERRGYDDGQFYPAKAKIGVSPGGGSALWHDMNPAHIVHEVLTDRMWGDGQPLSAIDLTSFYAAADLFADEGLGMSMLWNSESKIVEILREVERTTDSVIEFDEVEGHWTFKPIREDYVVAELPVFGVDNVIEVGSYTPSASHDLPTSVSVVYFDLISMRQRTYTVHDQAAILMRGREISESIEYPGVVARSVAQKIAHRDLRTLSQGRAVGEMTVFFEDGESLRRGDPFVLNWPEFGVEGVFRVGELTLGSQSDREVTISFIEDVFTERAEFYDEPDDGDEIVFDPAVQAAPDISPIPMGLWYLLDDRADLSEWVAETPTWRTRNVAWSARPSASGSPLWRHNSMQLLEQLPGSSFVHQGQRGNFGQEVVITAASTRAPLTTAHEWEISHVSRPMRVGAIIRAVSADWTADYSFSDAGPPNRNYDMDHLSGGIEQFLIVVRVVDDTTVICVNGLWDSVPAPSIPAQTALLVGSVSCSELGALDSIGDDDWFEVVRDSARIAVSAGRVWTVTKDLLSTTPLVEVDSRVSTITARDALEYGDISASVAPLGQPSTGGVGPRGVTRAMRPLFGASVLIDDATAGVLIGVEGRTRESPEITLSGIPQNAHAVDDGAFSYDGLPQQTIEAWVYDVDSGTPVLLRVIEANTSGTIQYTPAMESDDGGPFEELHFVVFSNRFNDLDGDYKTLTSWQPALLTLVRT